MAKIATDKSDVVILTSDNPKNEDPLYILDDMLAGVGWIMQDYLKHGENAYYLPLPNGHRPFLHNIRWVAVSSAVAMGEEGDMVVVAGKGHETYQVEGDKKDFFADREECREALQYVDELHQAGIDTNEFPWSALHQLHSYEKNEMSKRSNNSEPEKIFEATPKKKSPVFESNLQKTLNN